MASWLSEKISKVKSDYAYANAANKQIKKKQEAEYYRAKEKEQLRLARERARIETNNKIKELKTNKQSSGGLFGGMSYNSGGSLLGNSPGMSSLMWGDKPAAKRHTRRKKPKYKTVKVRIN